VEAPAFKLSKDDVKAAQEQEAAMASQDTDIAAIGEEINRMDAFLLEMERAKHSKHGKLIHGEIYAYMYILHFFLPGKQNMFILKLDICF
jgi:hypothetical protein